MLLSRFVFSLSIAGGVTVLAGCGGGSSSEPPPSGPPATTDAVRTFRTGQTISYSAADDGALRRGLEWPDPRFTNVGGSVPVSEASVVDRLTGLVWTRAANAPGPPACNPNRTMNWDEALSYVDCLNANNYLGVATWRLPNRRELTSLLHYGSTDWMGWMTMQGFEDVGEFFWSSTWYAWDPSGSQRWTVGPTIVSGGFVTEKHFIWPVSGSSARLLATGQANDGDGVAWPVPRFVDPQAGTSSAGQVLVDALTGLMWTRDANSPGPAVCQSGAWKTWDEALAYIECLNANRYLGYGDWVLPNVNELESLVNLGEASQAAWLLGQGFANVQSYAYRSSTTDPYAVMPFAWSISMREGMRGPTEKAIATPVWPVRGLP